MNAQNLLDPNVARAALDNPATPPTDLGQIAQHHASLRAAVAMHPAAYPELLDWLDALGDPVLSAVVKVRRSSGPAAPTAAPATTPQQFVAQAPVAQAPAAPQQFVAQAPGAQAAATQAPFAPTAASAAPPRRRHTKLLLGAGAGVLAVALVITGFATRGFGLFPAGGSATPEEESVKVVTKTAELFNSFSAKNLLSNPLSAIGSMNDELAPSEARLSTRPALGSGSGAANLDTTDLLGITDDTVTLISDTVGSFHVEVADLETKVTELTEDIAVVHLNGGTVTVTADTAKLRGALEKMPDVTSKQLTATAEKYGLHPNAFSLEDELPEGWLDDTMNAVEDRFPLTIDLAEYDRASRDGTEPPDYGIYSMYSGLSNLVIVRENGRWYLSSMLTSYLMNSHGGLSLDDLKSDDDLRRALNVEPAQNSSPTEAAEGLAKAISSGRERSVLSELPLAERRYAAFTRILASLSNMDQTGRPDTKFTEIARNGDHAKLRIDEYSPVYESYGEPVSIQDGTCVSANGETHCLADYLDSGRVADAFDSMRDSYYWGSFEDTTGINPDDLIDRLETAATRAVETIDPDQIGVVAVQENGNWFVSATATAGDLQNQVMAALTEGLKAAQNR